MYDHTLVLNRFPLIPPNLKPQQLEIVEKVIGSKDVCGLLPTGFGKSLTFVLPALFNFVQGKEASVTLVVSPLKALQENQQESLRRWGIPSAVLNEDTDVEMVKREIDDNGIRVIISTPEAIAGDTWHDTLIKLKLACICFDEAHVVITWGQEFRESYIHCSELRAWFTGTPFLLLTATMTEEMRKEVMQKLHIDAVEVVSGCLDRSNITLVIKSEEAMQLIPSIEGYLNRLRNDKKQCPKCIIFTHTIAQAVEVYTSIMLELWEKAFATHIAGDTDSFMVAFYHSELTVRERQRVLTTFSTPDSMIRLVIATSAFSLGVDIPDVRTIIQWGTPKDLCTFWQQAGRAGRDGAAAECICFATRVTYHKQKQDIKEMVEKLMKKQLPCVRRYVLNHLGSPIPDDISPMCCNLCNPNVPLRIVI